MEATTNDYSNPVEKPDHRNVQDTLVDSKILGNVKTTAASC